MTLAYVEAFGPTIQGEGPQSGRACSFVRFGACNLSCSWCDSAYTWDAKRYPPREQITLLDPQAVINLIPAAPMLVITGGEPLMQQKRAGWAEFLRLAEQKFPFITIETNGTIMPDADTLRYVDQFVVSPKLQTVNMLRPKQSRKPMDGWLDVVVQHGKRVDFKIVLQEPEDVQEALQIADAARIGRKHLWLMPEGVTTEALAEKWPWVATAAAENGCNASHRLHVLVWGEERGH